MNTNFKKKLLAVAVSTALAGSAAAGDLNGWYVGGSIGEGSLTGSANTYYGDFGGSETNLTYGLFFGRNWQSGAAVMGIEMDYNTGSLEQTTEDLYGGSYYQQTKWDWYGSIRGRAGLNMDNTYLYATAGFAWAAAQYQYCYYANCTSTSSYDASSDSTEMGLTYGFGVEWTMQDGFFDGMSVRAEYLKVNIDTVDALRVNGDPANFNSSLETLRVGVAKNF